MIRRNDDVYEIDLLKLIKILWYNIRYIVLVTFLSTAIAGAGSYFLITPEYEANIMVYVNNSSISVGSAQFAISSSEISAAQSLVDTYIVILESRNTLNEVIKQANLDFSYQELSSMVSASAVNATEIFSVKVTDTDPERAKDIANTIADVLPEKISDIVDGSSVRIVDYAIKPIKKSAPSNTKNALIGMLIGFIAVCAFIIIREMLDDVIRDEVFLAENFDIPVLASIPDLMRYGDESYGYKYYDSKYYEKKAYQDTNHDADIDSESEKGGNADE